MKESFKVRILLKIITLDYDLYIARQIHQTVNKGICCMSSQNATRPSTFIEMGWKGKKIKIKNPHTKHQNTPDYVLAVIAIISHSPRSIFWQS